MSVLRPLYAAICLDLTYILYENGAFLFQWKLRSVEKPTQYTRSELRKLEPKTEKAESQTDSGARSRSVYQTVQTA
jgi:hypothetical protein